MSLFDPPPKGVYEYTEVIHFPLAVPTAQLANSTSAVGTVWADTLRTYLDLEQTGIVWWATVCETNNAKLIIDWKTADGRERFSSSPEAQTLRDAWATVTIAPVRVFLVAFPHDAVARQTALSSTNGTTSVLLTFVGGGPGRATAVERLAQMVLLSPGGGVATSCAHGSGVGDDRYYAAFRYASVEAMKTFLTDAETLKVLASIGADSFEPEFLVTRVYKDGWQGSVDKTRPLLNNPFS